MFKSLALDEVLHTPPAKPVKCPVCGELLTEPIERENHPCFLRWLREERRALRKLPWDLRMHGYEDVPWCRRR